jgi:hypothetical protein
LNLSSLSLEIADPNLIFKWTKNESTAIRFDYDSFSGRWMPMPGSSPEELGMISNTTRLIVQIPDLNLTNSPFSIYIGNPVRIITFSVQLVNTPTNFTSLTTGNVQIAQDTGELNFAQVDVDQFAGQIVLNTRQGFFDRSRTTGKIGSLPESSSVSYNLFLNPRPASGQRPRVRINYRDHLTPIEVPNESSFSPPASGTFQWSADTGKLAFSASDINSFKSEFVYYDGVFNGSFQLVRTSLGLPTVGYPSITFNVPLFVGLETTDRYLIFAEKTGEPRVYFKIRLRDSTTQSLSAPPSGTVLVDTSNGNVYLKSSNVSNFSSYTFYYLDTIGVVENGVGVQFFRSGANSGSTSSVGDFTIKYHVDNQFIGNISSDLIFLPTIPINNSNLSFTVKKGTLGGTFIGDLKNNVDSTQQGSGYLPDFDNKKINISFRRTSNIELDKESSIIKIEPTVSQFGLEIEIDGSASEPGVDFDFNPDAGFLEFTKSIGENNPENVLNVSGATSSPNIFIANDAVFPINETIGSFLYINSGSNAGIYKIVAFISSYQVLVSPNFQVFGSDTADFRKNADVIADRFFTDLLTPLKKFKLERANSINDIFTQIDNSLFTLLATNGQVNLKNRAKPGEVFKVMYVYLQSDDEGVTTTPQNITEFASFPIRQEIATTTIGSNTVTFNQNNRQISDTQINVYVNGVTLDTTQFELKNNNEIELSEPITSSDTTVTVTYFVDEAVGGETSFTVKNSPIDIDTPSLTAGSNQILLNGNQTNIIQPGSPVLFDNEILLITLDTTYDSTSDITTITFTTNAPSDITNPIIQIAESIFGYTEQDASTFDVIPSGSGSITVSGNNLFRPNTVITINEDPYFVIGSNYDSEDNKTTISLSSQAIKNYIFPTIIKTIRPIFLSGKEFQTSNDAKLDPEPIVIRMGQGQKILVPNVDYTISDGGLISLVEEIGYGQSLYAMYVARSPKPVGTSLTINYANLAAPGNMTGQRLLATYDLLAPDSFFYRVETVETFIPEAQQVLEASARSGGVSGPNIGDSVSLATKDQGSPGLYYNEQHLGNLDYVFIQLLKLYNDLINAYEDILSNTDGRVVGGLHGKFRFDGITDNSARTEYDEITNDIDDKIEIYRKFKLTSLTPLTFTETPIYRYMWQDNRFSRVFPRSKVVTAGIGNNVNASNFGETIGSLEIEDITSTGKMSSSNARLFFNRVEAGNTLVVSTPNGESINGDVENGIPAFVSGKEIEIRRFDGTLELTADITSITTVNNEVKIQLNNSVSLQRGTIFRSTSDSNDSSNHFYTVGRDLDVDSDNGQIINSRFSGPLASLQTQVVGSELIDVRVNFRRSDTEPFRPPVLDGSIFGDDGRYPEPLVKRDNELRVLSSEADFIDGNITKGSVSASGFEVTFIPAVQFAVGYKIKWLSGPNVGTERTITAVVGATVCKTNSPSASLTTNDALVFGPTSETIDGIFDIETKLLISNVESPPAFDSLIGVVNSQILSSELAISNFGKQIISSTGTVTSANIITDTSVNFVSAEVTNGHLLFVISGSNRGLYQVSSVTTNSITINTTDPYSSFPSTGSTSYLIYLPHPFLTSDQFGFISKFERNALDFLSSTQAWSSSMAFAGKLTRRSSVYDRISYLNDFIEQITDVLQDGGQLYETRYTWIKQRTDKEIGTLMQKNQAIVDRLKNVRRLAEDQKKLLISQNLA